MYLFIFIFLSTLAFFLGDRKPTKFVVACLFIFFVLFVGLRGDDVDNDYMMYYYCITEQGFSTIAEVSFSIISGFFYKFLDSYVLIFVFYATLGIALKLIAFQKYSNFFWLTMVIYFPTFFILQEMNAIRAGVACGFMLLSLKYWKDDERKNTILLLLAAVFFHYSFLIMIPLVFLVKNNNEKLKYYLLLIPLGYILYYTVDLTSLILLVDTNYIKNKASAYSDVENDSNVFSTVFIIKMIFILLLYFYRKKLAAYHECYYLFLKFYCIGMFVVVAIAKLPAASMRFLDLFIIVELFLLPLFLFLFRKEFRWIPTLILISYSSFYFYLYVDVAKYIRDYYTILEPHFIR